MTVTIDDVVQAWHEGRLKGNFRELLGMTPEQYVEWLRPTPAVAQEARDAALEEAAKRCEMQPPWCSYEREIESYTAGCADCAAAIRAMKERP